MQDTSTHGPAPAQADSLLVRVRPLGWVILLALGLYFISPLSTVMLGVLAACIVACTLRPVMDWIPGPRGLGVAVVGLGLVAGVGLVIFSLSWPLAAPISTAVQNWPENKHKMDITLKGWSKAMNLETDVTVENLLSVVGDFLLASGGQQLFSRGADALLGVLISLAFTLIGSIFLLSEPPDRLLGPGLRLLSPSHRSAMNRAFADLAPRYRRWVIGTLTGMTVVFTASMIGYSVIGLKLAVPLALLAGFAEIVPTVGPAIACVIAVLFAAATESGAKTVGVLAVYGGIQAIEAYIILPLIMRGAVNMHPAVTLFSVVLWGKVFGLAGLMLAIPINLTIWTLINAFRAEPHEQPVDRKADEPEALGDLAEAPVRTG